MTLFRIEVSSRFNKGHKSRRIPTFRNNQKNPKCRKRDLLTTYAIVSAGLEPVTFGFGKGDPFLLIALPELIMLEKPAETPIFPATDNSAILTHRYTKSTGKIFFLPNFAKIHLTSSD